MQKAYIVGDKWKRSDGEIVTIAKLSISGTSYDASGEWYCANGYSFGRLNQLTERIPSFEERINNIIEATHSTHEEFGDDGAIQFKAGEMLEFVEHYRSLLKVSVEINDHRKDMSNLHENLREVIAKLIKGGKQ